MKVKLKDEEKEKLALEVQKFFSDDIGFSINNLQSELIIRFMTERFGAYFYGQGLRDAKDYLLGEFQLLSEGVLDLESDFKDEGQ